MMKNASIGFLLTVALAFSGVLYAQEEEPHVFTVVTWETLNPEDGSNAEFDSLAAIWTENVVKKNEFIVNEIRMTHMWGSNSSDYVILTEHKNFDDIVKAQSRNTELFREFMPDSEERAEYFKAVFKYFGNHSDEIYQGN
jgi:hypothetical protein